VVGYLLEVPKIKDLEMNCIRLVSRMRAVESKNTGYVLSQGECGVLADGILSVSLSSLSSPRTMLAPSAKLIGIPIHD
jgi:hypothetical protein